MKPTPCALALAAFLAAVPAAAADNNNAEKDTASDKTPAIFSKDYDGGGGSVEYADDPRLQYLTRLLDAVREASPEEREQMDPLVITARTYLRTPRLYEARQVLAGGRLVVVDESGATIRTDDNGEFSGTVAVPYEAAAFAFRTGATAEDDALARFVMEHVEIGNPVSLATYKGMMQRPIALLEKLPLVEGRFSPVALGERADNGQLQFDDDGRPLITEADLYYLLGGTVSGHVFLGERGTAVGDASAGYAVYYSGGAKHVEEVMEMQFRKGVYTRVGAEEHSVPVILSTSSNPRAELRNYYSSIDTPVPGSKG